MSFDWWRDHLENRHAIRRPALISVDDIIERVLDEHEAQRQREPPVSAMAVALGFSHQAPTWTLSAAEAYRHMQQHRHCSVDHCARKQTAWHALVQAGKLR